jgi:DNA polymerase III epsilon subunit-like protein
MNWWEREWTVYDLETTGVDPETCHVVQVAAVKMLAGQVVERRSMLVNPGVPIPQEASAIHGITDERVRDAEPEAAVLPRFCKYLAAADVLVGYNNHGYDDLVLAKLCGAAAAGVVRHNIMDGTCSGVSVDVLTLVRMDLVGRWWKGQGRHKLSSVAGRLGVKLADDDRLHWATTDCVTTGLVLWTMLDPKWFGGVVRGLPGDAGVTRALALHEAAQERQFKAWLAKQPPRQEVKA